MLFERASDEEFKAAGIARGWISQDEVEDEGGPYAPYHFFHGTCPCCEGTTAGWTVVDLQTATSHSAEWFHAEAEVEANEVAGMLNRAWLAGYRNGQTTKARTNPDCGAVRKS